MKKIYECPVMMTEVYETNAYCSSCGASIKNGVLTTDASRANRTNNGNGNWIPADGFEEKDLVHTFENSNIYETVDGRCTSGCDDVKQSIWKCTCHPDAPWYLEWSHYYSVHKNGKDTFFLYKEWNGNGHFDITPNSSQWPHLDKDWFDNITSDYNVAQIAYTEGSNIVVNS